MKRALPIALASLLLAAGPLAAQAEEGDLTLFERYAKKLQKNPALGKLVEAPPGGLDRLKWMAGKWDVTAKRYPTASVPERIQKGTRRTSVELGGWWLASIDDVGDLKAASLITEDAYSQKFARAFLSNWGGGIARPMISNAGWQDRGMDFEGAIVLFGEAVEVRLRISRADDDHYFEVWEEKLPGNRIVPIYELTLVRQKAAPAKPK